MSSSRDETLRRRRRRRPGREGEVALSAGADPVRADRAGGGVLRRPRSEDRRPRNDVPKSEWGGFHRIEKALWEEDTAKVAPVADQLLADVEELQSKVRNVELQAVQIANGANELLGEVSASKITGEEERYSHIDLVDFEANVEGAEAAFASLEPLLSADDPEAAKEIEADFDRSTRIWSPIAAATASSPTPTSHGRHAQARAVDRRPRREALAGAGRNRRLTRRAGARFSRPDPGTLPPREEE